jgi:hypothetical protein
VEPVAGDLAFALPDPQDGRGPAGPSVGQLALAGDGIAGTGAAEAVGLAVAEVAGRSRDPYDHRVFGWAAAAVRGEGLGSVLAGGVVVQAGAGGAGRGVVSGRRAPASAGIGPVPARRGGTSAGTWADLCAGTGGVVPGRTSGSRSGTASSEDSRTKGCAGQLAAFADDVADDPGVGRIPVNQSGGGGSARA